ncbi:MAG: hypothetical protein FD180_1480 [Planctomycetota bacterium]|nr:MAG: hypothetical protein FD180_1480 [Planctomycetota bacterium]
MPPNPQRTDVIKAAQLVASGRVFQARSLLSSFHRVGNPIAKPIRAALGTLWELDLRSRIRVLEALEKNAKLGRVDAGRLMQLRWLLARRQKDLHLYFGLKSPTMARIVEPHEVVMGSVETDRGLIEALALKDRGDEPASGRKITRVLEATAGQLFKLQAPVSGAAILRGDLSLLTGQSELFEAWADYKSQLEAPVVGPLQEALRKLSEQWDDAGLEAFVDFQPLQRGQDLPPHSAKPRPFLPRRTQPVEGTPRRPVVPRTIHRTPHVELSPKAPVKPAMEFTLTIWADTKPARKGEDVTPIDVEVPPGIKRIDLVAELLVSDHFEPVGDHSQPFPMEVSRERTERIDFRVRVRCEAELRNRFPDPTRVDHGGISVLFLHRGRPAGEVRITVPIAISSSQGKEVPPSPLPGTIAVDPTAKPADLIVQIHAVPEGEETDFCCFLRTSLIKSNLLNKCHTWKLKGRAERIVRDYMKQFVDPNNDAAGRLGELRGAGLNLFDASPKQFRKLFWQLVDANKLPRTIAIVTDEPFIPWELMIPNRGDQERQPLGVEFVIGRWVPADNTSGPQRFAIDRSLVIAPSYGDTRDLPTSKEEAVFVLGKVPGRQANPAEMESITKSLTESKCNLVHFVGHGSAAGGQSLDLEQLQTLTSTKVRGCPEFRSAFSRAPTLVVLNACEVGRPAPALSGVGGLVQALVKQRAGGVIAALWSVEDDIAHLIAKEFYEEALKNPALPFAEILRGIRARAYDEKNPLQDTYAAYCFYGDPWACRE